MNIKVENKRNYIAIIGLMIMGAFLRLIPHAPNFTPTESIAIFGAAYLGKKHWGIILTIVMLYLSDFVINNTILRSFFADQEGIIWFAPYMIFSALAIVMVVFLTSGLLKKISFVNVFGAAVMASLVFFLVTNFGSWLDVINPYPNDISGLIAAYIAGLPFLGTSLLGNLIFTTVLFGSYEVYKSFVFKKELV